MATYATKEDVAEYLHTDEANLPDDVERLLARASELIDGETLRPIKRDKAEHMEAAKNAVCAQIEYWIDEGEDGDIGGPIQGFSLGSLQVQYGAGRNRVGPTYLAPRARRFLLHAGLLYRGVGMR